MPIAVRCPSCESSFQVADEHAGKRGKCRRCGEIVAIPAATPPATAPVREEPAAVAVPGPSSLETLQPAPAVNDDPGVYELAGSQARKTRSSRVRQATPTVAGAGAAGVREAAAPTRKTLSPGQILTSFRGEIEPVRPTLLYRAWILIVAGIMVLLPLVYVALIFVVAATVLWYAVAGTVVFGAIGHGRGAAQVAVAAYVAPLIMGCVVVAFMLKPLFARPSKGPKQKYLDPQVEPLLFAFVDGVCTSVGSPRPARVAVNCEVNASAGRQGGLLWGVVGGELILTIGLPLAAGLNLRQFAGVLAHEFGHFSQGAGMRLLGLIRRINFWFTRVVYERDEWDESLESWSRADHWAIALLGHLARGAVWLIRKVLWALMWVGHVASSFLARQMEYDADRYEARMVGGEIFASTCRRLRELNMAERGAYVDLQSSWQQRRLPDNFPKLVLANVPQIPEEVRAEVIRQMEEAKTGLFDTHPADRDRIAMAREEEPGEGLFRLAGPATDLFRDFDALARSASFTLYKSFLGPELTKDQLYEVSELIQDQAVDQEGYAAASRLFLDALPLTQRFPLPDTYPQAPASPAVAKRTLIEARERLLRESRAIGPKVAGEDDVRRRLYLADTAWTLLKAGMSLKPGLFELKAASVPAAEAAYKTAEDDLRQIEVARDPIAQAAASRLATALSILELDAAAGRIEDGPELRDEARYLYRCVAHLGGHVMPVLDGLARARDALGGILQSFSETKSPSQELVNAVLRASSRLRDELEQLRWKVGDAIDYPFEHSSGEVTLGKFAFPPTIPAKEEVGDLMDASTQALDRLTGVYRRAIGRLCVAAEEVEKALGLPPLEVPEPAEADG